MNPIQWLFGPAVSRTIMTAQRKEDEYQHLRALTQKDGVHIKQSMIPSTRGAELNMAEFSVDENPNLKEKKILIFAMGRSGVYEEFYDYFVGLANKYPNYHIVSFNFRNVNASTGVAFGAQDWFNDAKSILKHFLHLGCQHEDIVMSGHSLGASITTCSVGQMYHEDQAKAFKKKDNLEVPCIGHINNRSFSNMAEEIMASFLTKRQRAAINGAVYGVLGSLLMMSLAPLFAVSLSMSLILGAAAGLSASMMSILHKPIGFDLLRPWMKTLLYVTFGSTMDSEHYYLSMPESRRDYLYAKNDKVIRKQAGLHTAFAPQRKLKRREFTKALKAFGNDRESEAYQEFKQEVLLFRDRKLRHRFDPNEGYAAHNDLVESLTTYHKAREFFGEKELNGQEVLENKIKRLLNVETL